MKKEMQDKWDAAWKNPGVAIPIGRIVVCDSCDGDYTDSPESGGLIFEAKAICPKCAPDWLEAAERWHEESFIEARCPEGKGFADFIRYARGPDACIRVGRIKR